LEVSKSLCKSVALTSEKSRHRKGHVIMFEHLKNILSFKQQHKPKVVILTGAGISAESGIATFRDSNGLWENHSIEEVATPEGFAANPALVYEFYNQRRAQLLDGNVQPNIAHIALSKLEKYLGDNLTLITQNVDNLHERAGSENLLHMHGCLTSMKCTRSGMRKDVFESIDQNTLCDCCSPNQAMRPDIVWFGEMPYFMDEIEEKLSQADVFVSIGTSGNVYPAAGFVQIAKHFGALTVELNLEATHSNLFDEQFEGTATDLVPLFVDAVLSS
jgi:NAD-dependent deacetylase